MMEISALVGEGGVEGLITLILYTHCTVNKMSSGHEQLLVYLTWLVNHHVTMCCWSIFF